MYDKKTLLKKAKYLIDSNRDEDLRYACLDLRSCIELACYEKFKLYIDEIPPELIKTWQPRRIMQHLKEIDPFVDANLTVAVAEYSPNGIPVENMKAIGRHNAITFSFIKDTYDKLGSFIHVPVLIKQREVQCKYFSGELRDYLLNKVVPEIERLCKSTLDAQINEIVSFKCQECNKVFKRSERSLKTFGCTSCSFCGAEYNVSYKKGKAYIILKVMFYKCSDCQAVNDIKKYQMKDGMEITCDQCHSRFILQEKAWSLKR